VVAESVSPYSGGTVPDSHRSSLTARRCGARDYHRAVPDAAARASFQSRWLPAIAWACLIVVLSGTPSLSSGLGTWDLVLRKLAHATEYAVLAALLTRALAPLGAFLAAVGFAVTDELHQALVPGRSARPLDVLIDAAGALVGLLLLRRWLASRR
jgi:VanZ family protein